MFERDRAISEWRQQMAAGGIRSPDALDELESHLRDDLGALVSGGIPEAQAFRLAASRLGDAGAVSLEFKKLHKSSSLPLTIGAWLWIGLATALAAGLLVAPGKHSSLLMAHIFFLTTGYAAAFLAGGFGIYYVCCRWYRPLPTAAQALSRAVLSFTRLAAGLVLAGLLLGVFWSGQNLGGCFTGGLNERGSVCATGWLIAFWLLQRSGRVSARVKMSLCIIGNIFVSLAWFGAGMVAHGERLGRYWLLGLWLSVHVVFTAMALVPRFEKAEA